MTYDEYTSPDQPGPIAGYPWVEACIRQILESVPSRKVLLGVPLYHRLWTGKKVSEGPSAHATELAGQWRSTPVFDPIQQELMARSQNGETLDVVWYQNSESLRKRLDLVKKYRLRGFSAWRLGQEPPEIWKDVFVRRPGTRS
jgi:spore germination protein YaaH